MAQQEIKIEYVDKLKSWIFVLCLSLGVSIGINFYQRYFIDRQWKLIHKQADFIDELIKEVKPNPTSYMPQSII